MKKILYYAIVGMLIFSVLAYLSIAVYQLEIDMRNWGIFSRSLLVVFGSIFGAISGGMMGTLKD